MDANAGVNLWQQRAQLWIDRIDNLAARPGDSPDERLNKSLLLFLGVFSVLAAPAGAMYCAAHGSRPAAIWLTTHALASALGLAHFLVTRDRRLFQALQLGLLLITPPIVQQLLGGFAPAGALGLWAVLAPLGALMFYGPRASIAWFGAYLLVVVIGGALDPGTAVEPAAMAFTENLLLASCLIFILLRHFVAERARLRAALEREHALLLTEQEKSERLLLSILPAPIADRLKREHRIIADGFADVSVLFADIVGFTALSAHTDAARLVDLLNDLFSRFDTLAEKHGAEKIKTIGDAYMACAGLPVERPDHAEALAAMALDMLEAVQAFDREHNLALDVRIGINTGPVVAGVIGLKKFIYDLWGDTVNTASRMESHGQAGAIQVSATTYDRLKAHFRLAPRGMIPIKGKGEAMTYLLLGRDRGPADG